MYELRIEKIPVIIFKTIEINTLHNRINYMKK